MSCRTPRRLRRLGEGPLRRAFEFLPAVGQDRRDHATVHDGNPPQPVPPEASVPFLAATFGEASP